ncbi:MAG: MFS transporter [Clostridia bacterium]|nr:MFS transporter [Clostridia bacterium]
MTQKIKNKLSDVLTYWKIPMPGRYMTFKETAAYAGGGIGAYFIITMASQLIVSTNNILVSGAIGISFTDIYILYLISTFANIPLTAIRANMVDNSRNRAGKYRPFLLSMGIPTALISLTYVWFPYESLDSWFPGVAFVDSHGKEVLFAYIVKCAIVLFLNLLLQFFYNFFYDAYTNLIHVLSPNTQERTDVLAVKSVVYSLAPSIMNILTPIVAKRIADNNIYDISVYRFTYPLFAIVGIALTIVIFANTKEKIIQARSRVIEVRFIDAFKEVSKNKYFWIIALAGWLGFLEMAYSNLLNWSVTFGHTADGDQLGLIYTITGNASLWGMLLAPIAVRRYGKKKVLVGVNLMNVICILAMGLRKESIIWLTICIYVNYLFGAFEQILSPAIQADIRDYHQYKTGVRVDGMFATVATIGGMVMLVTSSVLPFVYESYGIYEGNGYGTGGLEILDVNTGVPGLLYEVMNTLILMAAIGAFLNVVPYFFYDLKEKQQKSIVRILKIRAMFEDYGNGVTNNATIIEAIDIIRDAREKSAKQPAAIDKSMNRKQRRAIMEENEEIEISRAVCEELEKFEKGINKIKYEEHLKFYQKGLMGLYELNQLDICKELADARELPKTTAEEKEYRKFRIEVAKSKLSARKAIDKYFKSPETFVQPGFEELDRLFDREDDINSELKALYEAKAAAKKEKNAIAIKDASDKIKALENEKKDIQKASKAEMDKHAFFARAAKPYLDAERIVKERENTLHFEEIAAKYDEAKARVEAERAAQLAEQKRLDEEKAAHKAALKAEKEKAKTNKKK